MKRAVLGILAALFLVSCGEPSEAGHGKKGSVLPGTEFIFMEDSSTFPTMEECKKSLDEKPSQHGVKVERADMTSPSLYILYGQDESNYSVMGMCNESSSLVIQHLVKSKEPKK